jgi:hypothetical protein
VDELDGFPFRDLLAEVAEEGFEALNMTADASFGQSERFSCCRDGRELLESNVNLEVLRCGNQNFGERRAYCGLLFALGYVTLAVAIRRGRCRRLRRVLHQRR